MKMSVNRASTILCVASCIFQGLCYSMYPKSKNWQPLSAISCLSIPLHLKMSVNTVSTQHQQSVITSSTQCQLSVTRVSTHLGVASCIVTARLHVTCPGQGNTSFIYSRLATSLRSLAIMIPLYYSTILTSTFATVSTDIPSYEAIHERTPLYYYASLISDTFRIRDFMN
jgi:hypothetical protein